MESRVRQSFNVKILQEAARLFAVEPASATPISEVENFVYACQGTRGPVILRITHCSHREASAIRGELEWMSHLFAGGVPLALPLHSIQGNLVEQIGTGEARFSVTAFPKLPGQLILDAGECTPEIYRQWGAVMGRIHALAKTYRPSDPALRRSSWIENDVLLHPGKYIPGQDIVIDKLKRLLEELRALPQDSEAYGLIHGDLTDVNFFVHDHRIAVFDFDDGVYHWFVYDIAIVLFDAMPFMPRLEMDEAAFGKFFWEHFYAGYKEEMTLDRDWLERLPQFMRLSQIYLYICKHKKTALQDLQEGERRWLVRTRESIENDLPCLKFELDLDG